ncbi:protease complex subunit PrcB family protein [Alkaliphilus transvaalensis]|uniref:protease complex subunit PrcB family protein n=1 Tax=Alkaliphilus transvaalensis TaxID=114628 RepID=UPI0006850181|nr:protease complex subunit PrcB family protein [Alkaliphilus transvaalensis]
MKKLVLLLSFIMIFTLSVPASASNHEIKVRLNGELVTFDVPPILVEGRVLVPTRGLFEKLGAKVLWDSGNSTVTIETDDQIVILQIDNKQATISFPSASKEAIIVTLDAPPQVINGRTMVPLRFLSEVLGTTPNWDSTSNTVNIVSPELSKPSEELGKPVNFTEVSSDELYKNKELLDWYTEKSYTKGIYSIEIGGKHYVLVSAGERPSGGYSLIVDGVYNLKNNKTYVEAILQTPAPDEIVTQALTYPTSLILVDSKEVVSTLDFNIFEVENVGIIEEEIPYPFTMVQPNSLTDQAASKWYSEHYQKEGIHYLKENNMIYILVAAGERTTGGYTVEINGIYHQDTSLYVDANVISPDPDMMVTQEITYPNVLLKLEGRNIQDINGFIFTSTEGASFLE